MKVWRRDLLSETLSPAARPDPIQCLHYALTRPGWPPLARRPLGRGAAGSIAYESASEEEKDYAATFHLPNISWEGHCMYCGHCAPCPAASMWPW